MHLVAIYFQTGVNEVQKLYARLNSIHHSDILYCTYDVHTSKFRVNTYGHVGRLVCLTANADQSSVGTIRSAVQRTQSSGTVAKEDGAAEDPHRACLNPAYIRSKRMRTRTIET